MPDDVVSIVGLVVSVFSLIGGVVVIGVLWGRFTEKINQFSSRVDSMEASSANAVKELKRETQHACDTCIAERKHVEEGVQRKIEEAERTAKEAQVLLDQKLDLKLGQLYDRLDDALAKLNTIQGQLQIALKLPDTKG